MTFIVTNKRMGQDEGLTISHMASCHMTPRASQMLLYLRYLTTPSHWQTRLTWWKGEDRRQYTLSLSRSDTSKARPPNPAAVGFCCSTTQPSDALITVLQNILNKGKTAFAPMYSTQAKLQDCAAKNREVKVLVLQCLVGCSPRGRWDQR